MPFFLMNGISSLDTSVRNAYLYLLNAKKNDLPLLGGLNVNIY